MATVFDPGAPPAATRHDAVVRSGLDRARRRIRLFDVLTGFLGLAVWTLGFALLCLILDRRHDLSVTLRQVAFLAYGGVAVFLAIRFVVWPLIRPINPYYAARALEQVLPDAKNGLINWLDLHGGDLPPAIRMALGVRAAQQARAADLDRAVTARPALTLGGMTVILVCALTILMVATGWTPFRSLLGRAFFPFGQSAEARATQLTLVRPGSGDAVVAVGQSVSIAVRAEGRVPRAGDPDAIRLLFRYGENDPYEEMPLEPEPQDLWSVVVPASRTHTGFYYKVVGGDAETPEYQIRVRAGAHVMGIRVTYRYRAYTGWKERISREPDLSDLRGTEAVLVATTNRPVKSGRMEVETAKGKQTLVGEMAIDEPHALVFRHVLETEGTYRIHFTATNGETNVSPAPNGITILPDRPPQVDLTLPAEESTVPMGGTLRLEGEAKDDFGLTAMTLRLRIVGGAEVLVKPYREGKSFQFPDGTHPPSLAYKDFVVLKDLRDSEGKPLALPPKSVLEGWVEAMDNCDFPGPNKGESRHFRVTLSETPEDPAARQREQDQAAQDQKQHEAQQDQQLQQERRTQEKQTGNTSQANEGKSEEKKPGQEQGSREKTNQERSEEKKPEGTPGGGASPNPEKAEEKQPGKPESGNSSAKSEGKKPEKPEPGKAPEKSDGKKPESGNAPEKSDDTQQGEPRGGTENPKATPEGGGAPGTPPMPQPSGEKPAGQQPSGAGATSEQGNPGESSQERDLDRQAEEIKKALDRRDNARGSQGGGDPKDEKASGQPRQPAPKEVADLENQWRGSTAAQRAEIEKKLEELERNAPDEATRKAAGEALGACKNGSNSGTNPGRTGSPPGGEGGQPTSESGTPNPTPSETGTGTPGEGKTTQRTGAGTERTSKDTSPTKSGEADPSHRRRAGSLQLEDLSRVDKKLLQELKMSEEEFRKFQASYRARVQRQQTAGERLPSSQGGNLRNLGSREILPGGGPSREDGRRTGQGQAPPEFRELFRRYNGR